MVGRAVMVTHAGLKEGSSRWVAETDVHPACNASSAKSEGAGSRISACLVPKEEIKEGDVQMDEEKVQWQEQWREHLRQQEDIEIETDALSLYGILRDR